MFVDTAAGNARLGLYSNSGSAPSSKLAETAEFTPTSGWNTHPVVTPVDLSPGTYWIVVLCSSGSLELGIQQNAGVVAFTGGRFSTSTVTYSNGLPSSFPASTVDTNFHFSVYATLGAKTLSMPADPGIPSTPTPLIGQGYSLAFQDEFDYYNRLEWNNLIWYDGPPNVSDKIYCDASVLHLVSYKPAGWSSGDSYVLINIASLGRRHWQEGYYECRMRWPSEIGPWPAYWLQSSDWALHSSCAINQACEIDMFEGNGPETTVFYGTCHSDAGEVCEANVINGNNFQDQDPIQLADNFRIYAVWWTPTLLRWYLDGVLTHQIAIGPSTSWDEMGQDMQLLLWMWTHGSLGGWGPGPDGTTPDEVHAEFDWVRVWQA